MNKKAILVALIISLGVSFVLWNKIQPNQTTPKVEAPQLPKIEEKKVKVIVCKKQIAAKTRIEASMINLDIKRADDPNTYFTIKEINASSVPDLAFTANDVASLTNRYTAVTILPDDIVTSKRLLDEDTVPNLARAIPAGKRAVSIAVSKASSVGGFIQQGDYVDVIATFRPRNGETITKLVLQDIQVLAIGNTYEFEGIVATHTPAIAASKAELITLALTPEDLEKLMYLDAGTTFRLVLKNPTDKDNVVQTKGATEQIVLKDIGHASTASSANVQQEQVAAPASYQSHSHSHHEEEVDDGKVEIMFGSAKRREIRKYSGPVRSLTNISNDQANAQIPNANISITSED